MESGDKIVKLKISKDKRNFVTVNPMSPSDKTNE